MGVDDRTVRHHRALRHDRTVRDDRAGRDDRAAVGAMVISARIRRRRAARILTLVGAVMIPAQVAVGGVAGAGAALVLLAAGLWTRPSADPRR